MSAGRVVSCAALAGLVNSHPVDCNITDDGYGQQQIWVPDCRGTGCNANGIDRECAWSVHDMELCEGIYGDRCHETAAARAAQHASGFAVTSESYDVDGYVCGGTTTDIYYPTGDGPFPILIYLHGSGGGVDGREGSFGAVASTGFVVVAPSTGGYPGSCSSSTEYEDAVTAWTASKRGGVTLSPGLAKVDWSKTGIWGYSMGGKTTPRASVQTALGVGAVVCSHGSRNSDEVTVPSMFLTGTADDSSSPQDVMLAQFNAAQSTHKVFSNIQGGTHTRPIEQGTMNPWIAKFFACHLSGHASDCDAIYGSGPDSLCQANNYAACTVVAPSLVI